MTFEQIILLAISIRLVLFIYRLLNKRKFDLMDITHSTILGFVKIKRNASKAGYMFEIMVRDMLREFGFEAEIAMTLKNRGHYPKFLYQSKGDCGLDIIAFGNNEIMLVQTKLYSKALTKSIVAECKIAHDIFKEHYKSIGDNRTVSLYIVTNNKLDNTARIFADQVGIKYMEEHDLNDFIYRANVAHKNERSFFQRLKRGFLEKTYILVLKLLIWRKTA